jgi:hypothetical protein
MRHSKMAEWMENVEKVERQPFFTVFYSSSDALLRFCFYMIHSQISWPRSGDCGRVRFEPGTAASSVWCRPVALAN